MSKTIEYSVAIPAYNRAHLIEETLKSILNQSHPPSEIVVVDDGSTDRTSEVITEFTKKEERVVLYRQVNKGPGAARKVAIELCSYDHIALCDSDDLWMPHHLEYRTELLRQYPSANFTFSNFSEFDAGARTHDKFASLERPAWLSMMRNKSSIIPLDQSYFADVLYENPAFQSTIVLTKELYETVGGINEAFSRLGAEDADLTRRCVAYGHVVCDKRISVKIRKHNSSFSASNMFIALGRLEILERSIDQFPEHRNLITGAIAATRKDALWASFYARQFDIFCDLFAQLSSEDRNFRLRLRWLFANLPTPISSFLLKRWE